MITAQRPVMCEGLPFFRGSETLLSVAENLRPGILGTIGLSAVTATTIRACNISSRARGSWSCYLVG